MRCARKFLVAAILLALFSPLMVLVPAAKAESPGNVLLNPGFEEGFTTRGAGEVEVANSWHPWWQDGPGQTEGYNKRPEYKPQDARRYGNARVRQGTFSQKWFNSYATHHAGIWQQVNVPANSLVTLRAYAWAWSASKDTWDKSDGTYSVRVGIDPTGGTDWASPNVVWSPENFATDQWVELTIQTRAKGGSVTAFLRGDAEFRMVHNDAYFDDASLTCVPPTPAPTNTPRPTNTPADTPTLTATPEPTNTPTVPASPTPSPTLTPVPGTIWVVVFDDHDGNGVRNPGEKLLAGARIELTNMQRTPIASHVTDGTSEPYAFKGLAPGSYIVTEVDPPGYTSISPNQWAATLIEGTQLDLYFADQFVPSPTPTLTKVIGQPTGTSLPPTREPGRATPTPIPEPAEPHSFGQWLHGVSGLLVAVVALALPLALRLLRSQL